MISTSSSIDKASIAKSKVFEESVQNNLAANMVSRWRLDEIINTNKTPDQWGSNTGTLYGTNGLPQLRPSSECVTDGCFKFDGVDDYVDCGTNSIFNFKSSNFLFSTWFKTNDSINRQHLMGFGGSSNPNLQFDMNDSGYGLWVFWNGTGNPNTRTTINYGDNKWHFIVFMRNSDVFTLIIDNIAKVTTSYTSPIDLSTFNFILGRGGSQAYYFNGLIDDIRIYNEAISYSQIKQNYITGLDSLRSKNLISEDEYVQKILELATK